MVVEQIIRPTGLIDPRSRSGRCKGQVDDLLDEIRERARRHERVLVTTLTKRMAEDLTDYLQQAGVRVRYLHSDIDAIERMEILRGLRLGDFDVLVGINLLREGLDLPEVSLVAILDADQEGFLRSDRSLIQTVGRAARHSSGQASSTPTGSPGRCSAPSTRWTAAGPSSEAYNVEHGITPRSHRQVARGGPALHPRGGRPDREGRRSSETLVQPDLHDPGAARRGDRRPRAARCGRPRPTSSSRSRRCLRDQINELRASGAARIAPRQRPAAEVA